MKNNILLFIALLLVSLSSCKMEYETTINKDGSGEDSVNIDMGGIGAMASMFDGMMDEEEEIKEEIKEGKMEYKGKEAESEPIDIKELFKNPGAMGEIDTTVNMYSAMPDSLKSHPKAYLMKNVTMNFKSDEDSEEMAFGLNFKYNSQAQKKEIAEHMAIFLDDENKDQDLPTDGISEKLFGPDPILDLENGILTIPAQNLMDDLGDELGGGLGGGLGGEDLNMEDESTKMMMQMMFGDSGLKATYHLPGEIEFVSDMDAKISGNSVTFNTSIMDLMEMEEMPKRVIKFKVN